MMNENVIAANVENEITTRRYVVPADKRMVVIDFISKLNKKARKFGLPEYIYQFETAFVEKRDISRNVYFEDMVTVQTKTESVLVVPIVITGVLSVNVIGWQFFATIEHLLDEGNLIFALENKTVPEKYRTVECKCEHCNISRRRNKTFLLENSETKQIIQVGSSCLKDFIGENCPENIIAKVNVLQELCGFFKSLEDNEFGGASENSLYKVYPVEYILGAALHFVSKFGYISKSQAEEQAVRSTADEVKEFFLTVNLSKVEESVNQYKEKIDEIIAWVKSFTDIQKENNYFYNVSVLIESNVIYVKHFGLITSLVAAYNKEKARQFAANISNYVGEVKQKIEFVALLVNHNVFDTNYGSVHLYTFKDESGNIFVWKASRRQNLEAGCVYKVYGTIKGHKEYRETKQTVLTRCVVRDCNSNEIIK